MGHVLIRDVAVRRAALRFSRHRRRVPPLATGPRLAGLSNRIVSYVERRASRASRQKGTEPAG